MSSSRVSDPPFAAAVDTRTFDPTWTTEPPHPESGGATSFTSQENSWFLYDPILSTAADCSGGPNSVSVNGFSDQTKLAFGLADSPTGQHGSDTFAHLLEQSLGGATKLEASFPTLSTDDRGNSLKTSAVSQDPVLFDTCPRLARSAPVEAGSNNSALRLPTTAVSSQQRASLTTNSGRAADTAKRRPRRSSGSSNSVHVGSCSTGDRGFSPSWSRRSTSMGNKSFSNSLSRFTLPDENGKRRIRNDIMSIAESLPALPGLYFDKKQKGFRVRYQNVYVGWVALSRFPSIEEAYISAREIWESAKCHAEKFQTPHAAVMASYPLQKEAQASGKNRGGRPRTVTQLPPDPSNWLSAGAFITHQNPSSGAGLPLNTNWPRSTEVPLYGHESASSLCDIRNTLGDTGVPEVASLSGVESFWSPAVAFSSHGSSSLLTPGSGSKSASETPHHANYTFCQPPPGYLNDTCGLLESTRDERPSFTSYTRSLCMPQHCADAHEAFSELEQQSEFCRQYSTELPGAISYSQPVPEEAQVVPEAPRKRRRDEPDPGGEPQSKRSDWTRPEPGRATPVGTGVQPAREASPPSDASTAIPPQSPNS